MKTMLNRIYVFKYMEEDEKIHIWYKEDSTPYYYFVGTLAKAWSNGGNIYQFYKLDENANEKITITFEQFYDLNPITQEGETVYMIRLPKYADNNSKIIMPEEVTKQAYYIDDEYCFCV